MLRHGAKVKRCSSVGCANLAQNGGVCVRHGAQAKLCSTEGCANHAKKGGVCIRHWAKKFSSTNAQPMGAQIMQRKEERVRGMGQRTNYVAMKDAGIKLSTEECASSMGQRRGNCAAMKNAPTKHTKEECA